jgi:hypothetical protein
LTREATDMLSVFLSNADGLRNFAPWELSTREVIDLLSVVINNIGMMINNSVVW